MNKEDIFYDTDDGTVAPLQRSFTIPQTEDEEIIALSILYEVLNKLDHSTQHRLLDYFKSRFNVLQPRITTND